MSVASWCSTCFCVVLYVCLCTGYFVMVSLNLTCLHCLQHSFFEHLFNFVIQLIYPLAHLRNSIFKPTQNTIHFLRKLEQYNLTDVVRRTFEMRQTRTKHQLQLVIFIWDKIRYKQAIVAWRKSSLGF